MNEAQQAITAEVARKRMAAFDRLPPSIRRSMEATAVIPDVRQTLALWEARAAEAGEDDATQWMLDSMDDWTAHNGGIGPVAKRKHRHRQISHKLAPPVPEYAHGA